MGLARSLLIGHLSGSDQIGIFGVWMTKYVGAVAYKYPRVIGKWLSIPRTLALAGSSLSGCARREDYLSHVLACIGDAGGIPWVLSW